MMELFKPIIIAASLLLCFAATLFTIHKNKRYRVNVYKIGDFMSHKLDSGDEQLESSLEGIYLCNKMNGSRSFPGNIRLNKGLYYTEGEAEQYIEKSLNRKLP